MIVFVLAFLILVVATATLVLLYPSEISGQKTSTNNIGNSFTSTVGNTVSPSTSLSSYSTQTYPSYPPPKNDTILLKDPCAWWCNSNMYDWLTLNDSALFGVPDPMLIKAQIALESAFNSSATSRLANPICGGGTDYGLMQINPNCNNVSESQLFNASYNLYWGIKFWANDYLHLQQKWGSSCNTSMVLAGVLELYNGGAGYVGGACGSFPKGMNYIGLVSKYYYPFSLDANYTPLLQQLNDTSTVNND